MAKKKLVNASAKKEFKKEIAAKLESAFPDLKEKLGDKKFEHRIKKVTKVFTQGLHGKDFTKTNGSVNAHDNIARKVTKVKKAAAAKQLPKPEPVE